MCGCKQNSPLCVQLLRDTPAPTPTATRAEEEEEEEEGPKEETQMRIMRWAKELQDASVVRT